MSRMSDEKWAVLTGLLSANGGTLLYNEAKRARESEAELKAEIERIECSARLGGNKQFEYRVKLENENATLKAQVEELEKWKKLANEEVKSLERDIHFLRSNS